MNVIHSYTNSNGVKEPVSETHLDKAIDLKLELQSVYSNRCNWAMHKKLMVDAGFGNSDCNESYRCLVKSYQKKVGRLEPVQKYADMVADTKLNSIEKATIEMRRERLEHKTQVRKDSTKLSTSVSVPLVIVLPVKVV